MENLKTALYLELTGMLRPSHPNVYAWKTTMARIVGFLVLPGIAITRATPKIEAY